MYKYYKEEIIRKFMNDTEYIDFTNKYDEILSRNKSFIRVKQDDADKYMLREWMQGKSFREIGRKFGVSYQTVRTRLGMIALNNLLEEARNE